MLRMTITSLRYVLCGLLLGSLTARAQRAAVRIPWQGTREVTGRQGLPLQRLAVKGFDNRAEEGGNPVYSVVEKGHLTAYDLSQAVYRPLTVSDKRWIDSAQAGKPAVVLTPGSYQHEPVTRVDVRLIRRNPATGRLERLMSYTPNARTASGTSADGVASDTTTLKAWLGSGSWGKVGVTQTGMYKLTGDNLRRLGLDPATLDPRNLHVLGRGGAMLPEVIGQVADVGLHEMAIQVVGQDDGRFDAGDYLLFYGEGPVTWAYSSELGAFQHSGNLYADTIQYIVGVNASPGLRVRPETLTSPSPSPLSSYQNMQVYEKESINLLKAGRRWFSESFDLTTSKDYVFQTPGLLAGSTGQLRLVAAARSVGSLSSQGESTSFRANIGGVRTVQCTIAGVTSYAFGNNYEASDVYGNFTAAAGDNVVVQLSYDKGRSSDAVGYLDFIEVGTRQIPSWIGRNIAAWFPELAQAGDASLDVSGLPPNAQAWNVTDDEGATLLPLQGSQVLIPGGAARAVCIFSPDVTTAPILIGKLANQSLASTAPPQLLIITAPAFLTQAQDLAQHRQAASGLSTLVVTPQQIYNEFTGGAQDVTALRDMVISMYRRSTSLRYVLLFGDCSFDYKNRVANNTNFVPSYASVYWQGPIDAFSTDDYFVINGTGISGDPSLATGRLPVKTPDEATTVVNKIKAYETDTTGLGSWRNVNMFAADNGDCLVHTNQSEQASGFAFQNGPEYLPQKFFLPNYPLVAGPGGQSSPEIREAIQRRIRQGALVVNYTGHGSEYQWADERIFDMESLTTLDNGNRLPFFITATCEYGRVDEPSLVSGAESLVLRAEGGAIGILSACRPVNSGSNFTLHIELFKHLFKPNADGSMPRLGDVMLATKVAPGQPANRSYFLLADPSLRLAYPRHRVALTSIRNAAGERTDTLRALQTVTLEGTVQNRVTGAVLTGYKGQIQVTLYDKAAVIALTEGNCTSNFRQRKSIIFNGFTRVDSGRWTITFQMPLDINYVYGQGLFSFYAKPDAGLEDANGVRADSLVVGGSATSAIDDTPPQVKLFMNDFSFRSGGIVGPNPTFLARVSDNTGINVSLSGVGHEMIGTFSYAPKSALVMNNFYVSDIGKPNQGTVRFPLQNLKPGTYTVYFKVWDLQNNSASDSLRFTVKDNNSDCPTLARPMVTPNPVNDKAQFSVDIDQVGKPLQVEVQVYDMLGRSVGTASVNYAQAPARVGEGLEWSSKAAKGLTYENALYFYRITTTGANGCTATAQGRMVINR